MTHLPTIWAASRPVRPGSGTVVHMNWSEYFQRNRRRVFTTAELSAAGADWRSLKDAVDGGYLLRARRGHYVLADTDRHTLEAVRVGGKLGCISAAGDAGVFAFDDTFSHIHLDANASRLRTPHDRFQRLGPHNRQGIELHWDRLLQPTAGTEFRVGLPDALAQIARCEEPKFVVASLDNALHQKLISERTLAMIFASLPGDLQYLRPLVDARSEAGQETVLRLIVQAAGFHCEIQVTINGVGLVDMLVEGCLVVEADSRRFHEGWEAQAADRRRDRDLAAQEIMSYRALYRDIMFFPERVIAAIRGLLAARNHFRVVIL